MPITVQLRDNERVLVTLKPLSKKGNKTVVEDATFSVSDDTLLKVTKVDEMSAYYEAVGPVGTAQGTFSADAKIGEGVNTRTGSLNFEIVAGDADTIEATAGAPEEIPEPAPVPEPEPAPPVEPPVV